MNRKTTPPRPTSSPRRVSRSGRRHAHPATLTALLTLTLSLLALSCLAPRLAVAQTTPSFAVPGVSDQIYAVNQPVEVTLPVATGGRAPLTYTLTPEASIPSGLSFNPADRTISGTPTTVTTATTLIYTVTDANGATAMLNVGMRVRSAVAFPDTAAIDDKIYTVGVPVSLALPVAMNGTGIQPWTYTLTPAASIPPGLTFTPGGAPTLSGTPTAAADAAALTYTLTGARGTTATLGFTITVIGALQFDTTTIPALEPVYEYINNGLIDNLTLPPATGGSPPLTYALTGSLPNGLNYNAGTRTISGTPNVNNLFDARVMTYTVTDSATTPNSLVQTFTLDVKTVGITWTGGNFVETAANDGTIMGDDVVATLSGDTFVADVCTSTRFSTGVAAATPSGITITCDRTSETVVTFTYGGTATAHADANDLVGTPSGISFSADAFTDSFNVVVVANSDYGITFDFNDPADTTAPTVESITLHGTLAEAAAEATTSTITEAQIGNSIFVDIRFSENMTNEPSVQDPTLPTGFFTRSKPYFEFNVESALGIGRIDDNARTIAHDDDFAVDAARCRAISATDTSRYLCRIFLDAGTLRQGVLRVFVERDDGNPTDNIDIADNRLAATFTSADLTVIAVEPLGVTSVTHHQSVADASAEPPLNAISTTVTTADPIYSVIQFAGPRIARNRIDIDKTPDALPKIFSQIGTAERVQFHIQNSPPQPVSTNIPTRYPDDPPSAGACRVLDEGLQGISSQYWCHYAPTLGTSGTYRIIVGADTATETVPVQTLGTDWDEDTGVTLAIPAEPLVFSSPTVADRIYPITLGSGTNDTITIPDLVLPGATGGSGTLNYALSPPASAGISGLSLSLSGDRIVGTPTQVGSQVFIYTVTDSATPDAQTASLTFKISVVDVQGDGTAVADADGTALAVNNVGTTDHNLRLLLPDGHIVNRVEATTYTPTPGTAPDGYTFSGVAMDIDLTPGSATSIPATIDKATVCLSITGVPDTNHAPALFHSDVNGEPGNTPTTWTSIGTDITTLPGFVCGTTRNFAPYFAVASMPTTPSTPLPLSFASTVANSTYTVGVTIPTLTLPEATGGTAAYTYTLTPTANIPSGLIFTPADRTLTGTPTTALVAALTYTVTDSTGATASQPFSVTIADNDVPGLTLTPVALTMDEGGTATYTVALTTTPSAAVTVTITGHDSTDVTLTPAVLTFTTANLRTAQTVTLTAAHDDDTANDSGTFTHTASGGGGDYDSVIGTVVVTVTDDDTPPMFPATTGIADRIYPASVDIPTLTLPEASGGSGTLTYALNGAIPTGLTFAGGTGGTRSTLTGIPNTATTASASLTYTVTDGGSRLDDSLTFSVSVFMVYGDGTPVTDEDGTALAVDNVGGENNDVRVFLPGGLTAGTTFTVTTYTPDAATVPAAGYAFSGVAVRLPISIPKGTEATVCLSIAGVPDGYNPALFHDPPGDATWTEIGSNTDLRPGFVCGTTDTFSPVAVGSEAATSRLTTISEIILPEVARAMTDNTVRAITQRFDQARTARQTDTAASAFTLGGQSTLADVLRTGGQALADGTLNMNNILGNSAFVLPLSSGGGVADTLTLWGSGGYSGLGGGGGGAMDWDGNLVSAHLGADAQIGDTLLAGAAVSWNQGDFDYGALTESPKQGGGNYAIEMTSITPYAEWAALPDDRLNIWGTAGYGEGEVTIIDSMVAAQTNDTSMVLWGGGASGRILKNDAGELRLKSELMQTQLSVAGGGNLDDLTVEARRMRVSLAGTTTHTLADGSHLTPSIEVGMRNDSGSGRTGTGAEVGGGVRYTSPVQGITFESRSRVLLGHTGDYDDWGIGGALAWNTGQGGQGLALRLAPTYGQTQTQTAQLWDQGAMGLTGTDAAALGQRMDAEVGYGLTALDGQGLLTPYSKMTWGQGARAYRLGSRLTLASGLTMSFEGVRGETLGATAPAHHLQWQTGWRWLTASMQASGVERRMQLQAEWQW